MSIRTCPECSCRVRVPDHVTAAVRCPKCKAVIPASAGGDDPEFEVVEDDDAPLRGKPRPHVKASPRYEVTSERERGDSERRSSTKSRMEDDDDDDDDRRERAPRRKKNSGSSRGYARSRVSGPASGLKVLSTITIGFCVLSLIFSVLGFVFGEPENVPQPLGMTLQTKLLIRIASSLFGIVVNSVILIGAGKMKNLESRGFALLACGLASIPCVGPCCIVGMIYGIWGLTVLNEDRVRRAFS